MSKPFYDFSECPKIEALHNQLCDNYDIVKREIDSLHSKPVLDVKLGSGDIYFKPEKLRKEFGDSDGWTVGYDISGTEWTQYPVVFQGKILPHCYNSLPMLASYLDPFQDLFYVLFISRLEPWGTIPIHSDGTGGKAISGDQTGGLERLMYQFYVDCPSSTIMSVDDRVILQTNREGVIFDSSYKHGVWNKSDDTRTILCGNFYIDKSR